MEQNLNHIKDLFRRHDLRHTRQRELVYESLASTKLHPTADELHQFVHRLDPGLSLATVYNTLEALTESGLCRKLPAPDGAGACRYDADMRPHVHVVHGDGRVQDVPDDLSDRILECLPQGMVAELESRMGVTLAGITVQALARPQAADRAPENCPAEPAASA